MESCAPGQHSTSSALRDLPDFARSFIGEYPDRIKNTNTHRLDGQWVFVWSQQLVGAF
jgi:hypothetical protein